MTQEEIARRLYNTAPMNASGVCWDHLVRNEQDQYRALAAAVLKMLAADREACAAIRKGGKV